MAAPRNGDGVWRTFRGCCGLGGRRCRGGRWCRWCRGDADGSTLPLGGCRPRCRWAGAGRAAAGRVPLAGGRVSLPAGGCRCSALGRGCSDGVGGAGQPGQRHRGRGWRHLFRVCSTPQKPIPLLYTGYGLVMVWLCMSGSWISAPPTTPTNMTPMYCRRVGVAATAAPISRCHCYTPAVTPLTHPHTSKDPHHHPDSGITGVHN